MAGQEDRATSLEPGWVDGVLMEQRKDGVLMEQSKDGVLMEQSELEVGDCLFAGREAERTRSLGPDSRRRAVAQSKGATSR